MKKNEYKCEHCGGIFKTAWSDEEAKKEFEENFKGFKYEEGGIVCDDCYKILMKRIGN